MEFVLFWEQTSPFWHAASTVLTIFVVSLESTSKYLEVVSMAEICNDDLIYIFEWQNSIAILMFI